jgi:hypothetical protein
VASGSYSHSNTENIAIRGVQGGVAVAASGKYVPMAPSSLRGRNEMPALNFRLARELPLTMTQMPGLDLESASERAVPLRDG